ncbi:hypothetical protein TNCV_3223141 [Trichonephila clavipes]|nr:hypothetical protein TNCV_3223141 [Trichonephila clavipes]
MMNFVGLDLTQSRSGVIRNNSNKVVDLVAWLQRTWLEQHKTFRGLSGYFEIHCESGIPTGILSVRQCDLACKMYYQPTEGNLEELSFKYFMRTKSPNLEIVNPDDPDQDNGTKL